MPVMIHRGLTPFAILMSVMLAGWAGVALAIAIRQGRQAWRQAPGLLFFLLACGCLWPALPAGARAGFLAGAMVFLTWHVSLHQREIIEREPDDPTVLKSARWYLGATLLLAGLFLFWNLDGFAGLLLVWESPVVQGFGKALLDDQPAWRYALDQFLWDDGLLSSGQHSLLYGAPTYALFRAAGISIYNLRLFPVLATLVSIPLAFALGRRFFGPRLGAALAVLLALNYPTLFYGRYGSSPAAGLLATLAAIYGAWYLLDREKPAWWAGPLAGVAVFVATLHYAPARLMVLALLAVLGLAAVWPWPRFAWRRALAVCLLALTVAAAVALEWHCGRLRACFNARGEQVMEFFRSPAYLRAYLGRDIAPDQLTHRDRIALVHQVLKVTIPQYAWFWQPHPVVDPPDVLRRDPPRLPLYPAPLLPFLLLGVGCIALRVWRSWKLLFLGLWWSVASAALLMTNRVDAHRIMLLSLPLVFVTALGLREAARLVAAAGLPWPARHAMAGLLIAALFYGDWAALTFGEPPAVADARAMAGWLRNQSGPLVVGLHGDERLKGWLNMNLLERARQRRADGAFRLLDTALANTLCAAKAPEEVAPSALADLPGGFTNATIVLAPKADFHPVAQAMETRGWVMATQRSGNLAWLVLTPAAAPPLPDRPPPDDRLAPWIGAYVPLDDLTPLAVDYGFKPPRNGRTWDDGPIIMDDVSYAHGVGMHAPCRVTYTVPSNAVAFQGMVGYADKIRKAQPTARADFRIEQGPGHVLFNQMLTAADAPRAVRVTLNGRDPLTLIVTEGMDGRDHDHVNLGDAGFLIPPTQPDR